MKKIFVCLAVAGMSLTSPVMAQQPQEPKIEKVSQEDETKALVSRLKEIDKMDKSKLSRDEKKELRKEVRGIEKRLKEVGGGFYISVGALILIIVLLALLV